MPATKDKAAAKPTTTPVQKTIESKLAKLGLRTDMDLVLHLPMRYEDETEIVPIREACLRGGHVSQVEGIVSKNEITYKPRKQLLVSIADETAYIQLRFMNFYGSQVKQLAEGTRVRARGEVRHGFFGAEMVHPVYKVVNEGAPLPTSLTPVYPSGEGLSQTVLRRAIADAMKRVDWTDTVPRAVREKLSLAEFQPAVRLLHYPPPDVDENALIEKTHPAWTRVKFDELLAQQLSLKRAQQARREKGAPQLTSVGALSAAFLEALPFKLTNAQQRVVQEISKDLREGYPMQRLLQGDVGSGKTVVAALAAAQAIDSGYQAALMAPTEILAEQHFRKIAAWMEPLGVKVAWLTGSLKKKEKQIASEMAESGEANLVIGTHALIQDTVQFAKLGLVLVDEQHRFGVGQRLTLRNKGSDGLVPHQLMMSATPIPRTLELTQYGELEVSRLMEKPPGRTPVATAVLPGSRIGEVAKRLKAAIEGGAQAYWICPLVAESEATDLAAAEARAEDLRRILQVEVGLAHGQMPGAQREAVMADFADGRIPILVATTVVEVGVDVPNASIMVIEHADRFGLAQLHQLRGRVGRGAKASACILLYGDTLGETAKERLETLRRTEDGFEIAEEDFRLRGGGDPLGLKQSGFPAYRFADPIRHRSLMLAAADDARLILGRDPDLLSPRGEAVKTLEALFDWRNDRTGLD